MCNLPFLTPDPVPGKDREALIISPRLCNQCDDFAGFLLPWDHMTLDRALG